MREEEKKKMEQDFLNSKLFLLNVEEVSDGRTKFKRDFETFSLEESKEIVKALVDAGIIGKESVEEHLRDDDRLMGIAIMPGYNKICWKANETK